MFIIINMFSMFMELWGEIDARATSVKSPIYEVRKWVWQCPNYVDV